MRKNIACILLLISATLSLIACGDTITNLYSAYVIQEYRNVASKADIFNYVIENEAAIMNAIETGDYSGLVYQGKCERYYEFVIFSHHGIIDTVYISDSAVYFYCGVGGFGSPALSADYYTSSGEKGSPVMNVGFMWKEADAEADVYTEHISGSLYYYEIPN